MVTLADSYVFGDIGRGVDGTPIAQPDENI
jgi:hypothetical protein